MRIRSVYFSAVKVQLIFNKNKIVTVFFITINVDRRFSEILTETLSHRSDKNLIKKMSHSLPNVYLAKSLLILI